LTFGAVPPYGVFFPCKKQGTPKYRVVHNTAIFPLIYPQIVDKKGDFSGRLWKKSVFSAFVVDNTGENWHTCG
jgi:hypothetical protein